MRRTRPWRVVPLAVLVLGWGCRPVVVPPAPAPAPAPGDPVAGPLFPSEDPDLPLERPPEAEPDDPILGSPAARDTAFRRQVEAWVVRWTTEAADWFPLYLKRMGSYAELVDGTLGAEGLPPSLRYLPIVESGYSPRAVSRAAAAGMWQFMTPTARSLGLEVTPMVDERRDPVRSTLAAARFLDELHDRFGSWFLALAAYNGGPSRVDRLLRRHAPLAGPSDELYFTLQPHLPRETADFVAKFFGAVEVARSADRYGVAPEAPGEPVTWDEVEVPDATSLDVVAEAAGVSEDEVVALNPHILRKVTPRGRATTLRLPAGAGAGFEEAYAAIPPDRRVTVEEHVVASGQTLWGIARLHGVALGGQTLWGIARLHGVALAELQAANPNVDARRLRPGHRLMVPREPGVAGARSSGAADGAEAGGRGVHVVRSGDTLWDLARRYGIRVDDLLRWNGLADGATLQPGQRLRVSGA